MGLLGLLQGVSHEVLSRWLWAGVLNDDRLSVGLYHRFQLFDIQRPVLFRSGVPEINLSSEGLGDLIELLVGWVVTYHVVSGADEGVEHKMIRGDSSIRDQNVICR